MCRQIWLQLFSLLIVLLTKKEIHADNIVLLQAFHSPTRELRISKCGKYIAARSGTELTVWKMGGKGVVLKSRHNLETTIMDFVFREDELLVARLVKSNSIVFVRLKDGRVMSAGELKQDDAWAIFSPDASSIIGDNFARGDIELWDFPLRKQEPIRIFHKGEGSQLFVFSRRKQEIANVNFDNVLRIWDTQSGRIVVNKRPLPNEAGPFHEGMFLGKGNQIILGYGMRFGWELEFCMYDIERDKIVLTRFPANGDAKVQGLVFGADGSEAFTCDNKGSVFSYSLSLKSRRLIYRAQDDFRSVAISPNGDYLAVGGWTGTIAIVPINNLKAKGLR